MKDKGKRLDGEGKRWRMEDRESRIDVLAILNLRFSVLHNLWRLLLPLAGNWGRAGCKWFMRLSSITSWVPLLPLLLQTLAHGLLELGRQPTTNPT